MSGADDWKGKLGFGKPPPWGRFRKGQSGNPSGRPKKRRAEAPAPTANASDTALRNQMEREFAITENGKVTKVLGAEAVRKSQLKSAVSGNPQAQRLLLEDYRQLELRDAAEAERLAREQDKYFENCKKWRENQRRAWSQAEASGGEPECPWPHPDDFLFNETGRTVGFRGPISEQNVLSFEYYRLQRDIAFARSVELLFFQKPPRFAQAGLWDAIWIALNALLPKRWQIIDIAAQQAMIVFANTPRKLRKAIESDTRHAELVWILAKIPPPDKQTHKFADTILKPLLRHIGYHSLAHLEAEFFGQEVGQAGLVA